VCRNIRILFNFDPPSTEDEIGAAALQYVRKVTGMRAPSAANRDAFERAVREVTEITRRLVLDELETSADPRDRDVEKERARARGKDREARILARLQPETSG
jgi:hypothetical protein